MSRVVAFEGPDLTGKTSLLDLLQERMPYAMWPRLSYHPTRSMLDEEGGATLDLTSLIFHEGMIAASKQMPFVMDRCYVTNYVYGLAFDRGLDLDRILSIARRLRPVIVYVSTPTLVLVERLKWRGDKFVKQAAKLAQISDLYDGWATENPFSDVIVYCQAQLYQSKEAAVDWIDNSLRRELKL